TAEVGATGSGSAWPAAEDGPAEDGAGEVASAGAVSGRGPAVPPATRAPVTDPVSPAGPSVGSPPEPVAATDAAAGIRSAEPGSGRRGVTGAGREGPSLAGAAALG